jgi:hypothetical protein
MTEIDVSFVHGEPTHARITTGVKADIEDGVAKIRATENLYRMYSDGAHERMREQLLKIPKIEKVVVEE